MTANNEVYNEVVKILEAQYKDLMETVIEAGQLNPIVKKSTELICFAGAVGILYALRQTKESIKDFNPNILRNTLIAKLSELTDEIDQLKANG